MLWWRWKQQNRSTILENSRDTFSLFPQLQLSSFNNFLQRARDGSEKIKTSTRRHPPSLFSKRSEIFPSGRFSTTVRRQPLLGIETPEEFIYSSGSVNECKRKCHRRRLVDSSIYKMLFEKSNLTPSSIITLLIYPADWKQHLKTNG